MYRYSALYDRVHGKDANTQLTDNKEAHGEMANEFRRANQQEEEHLADARRWLKASAEHG